MIRNLYTEAGLLIAKGYDHVVEVGDRGPYVECNHEQIVHDSIRRIHAAHYYFDEYRSNCESNVMVELQRMPVSNADYVVGKYYISPSEPARREWAGGSGTFRRSLEEAGVVSVLSV